MRVRELAVDLKVGTEVLLRFLRKSGVAVGHADASIRAADVARVRMRLERERRAGRGNAAEVMRDAVKGSRPKSRRRRVRRRRTAPGPSPSAVEEVTATGDLDTAGELRATELSVADAETLTETVAASDTSLLATTGRREGRPAAQEEAVSAASETPRTSRFPPSLLVNPGTAMGCLPRPRRIRRRRPMVPNPARTRPQSCPRQRPPPTVPCRRSRSTPWTPPQRNPRPTPPPRLHRQHRLRPSQISPVCPPMLGPTGLPRASRRRLLRKD